jgi:2-succinyl-6-hydroxy-2,4-cyclohexadiene-1-carboxylate synthase
MNIWALHGFLGRVIDFQELETACQKQDPQILWKLVDFMHSRELSPQTELANWGEHFNKWTHGFPDLQDNVLLGYSMGGRLALQALKNSSNQWRAAILLSTQPGIPNSEKPARLKSDEEWAEKFLNQNFQTVLEKWNAQPVFQGSVIEPSRRESDFNRRQLADCLTQWSLARQEDFYSFLKNIRIPILYISGGRDAKYTQVGRALAGSNPFIKHVIVTHAGHRVMLDDPQAVAIEICHFLKTV